MERNLAGLIVDNKLTQRLQFKAIHFTIEFNASASCFVNSFQLRLST